MTRIIAGFWALVAPVVVAAAGPAAPEILKVEPPGWWAGHSLNPVRLMIRGRNLSGARLESSGGGLRLGAPAVNASGTYLFVDAKISSSAKPGPRTLTIAASGGRAEALFRVLEPLPRPGRFAGFSPDDVVYLIMPDRFADGDPGNDDPPTARGMTDRTKGRYYHGGDLQGVIDRLPYIKDLGVTAVWLTPVYANSSELYPVPSWSPERYSDYHGYGPVDYYAVDAHLGDVAKLRELTDKAHALGLKVILDQVANHTGPRHPWAKDAPTPTWFNGTPEKHLSNTFQDWLLVDPHASAEARRAVLEGWYVGILPDLNQNDPEAARYLTQNMLWWIGMTGLDGLRQDTFDFVPRPFWRDCLAAIRREYPALKVMGEVYGTDPALAAYFQGGRAGPDGVDTGLDSVFDFSLMSAVRHVFLEGKPVSELAVSLSRDHLYPNPDMLVTLLGSQDEPRFMGRPGASQEGLKLGYAFLMTTRGIPLIYYGDEIALQGGSDPDNRRDFPGGWPGDPRDAFSAAGRTLKEESVFQYVRRLARLRAELKPLRRGRLYTLAAGEKTYAYARRTGRSWAVVVLNNGDKPETVEFDLAPVAPNCADGELADRLGSPSKARVEGGRMRAQAPGHGAAVYARGER